MLKLTAVLQIIFAFSLGIMVLGSSADVEPDLEEAARWFRRGAEAGDALAMAFLASFYVEGLGVSENRAEAIRLYQRAADLGEEGAADALERLGVI